MMIIRRAGDYSHHEEYLPHFIQQNNIFFLRVCQMLNVVVSAWPSNCCCFVKVRPVRNPSIAGFPFLSSAKRNHIGLRVNYRNGIFSGKRSGRFFGATLSLETYGGMLREVEPFCMIIRSEFLRTSFLWIEPIARLSQLLGHWQNRPSAAKMEPHARNVMAWKLNPAFQDSVVNFFDGL